ncbi:hypothetical protein BC939DRAFT_496344, partial [Gamsiella multidivaricata]|uniref:uncharacterized protein n=1 Tax=Gamsiella multidivaricata TaxID=101098 RepID=UPI002220DD18
MDKKEGAADLTEHSSPSALAPPHAAPARRRSKLACDTCHYRKIKCDVEKGHPCRNCERSAVQCTLVGPSMRPPRNISGSTSAAAAAAVAVAVATAAAASAHSGTGSVFNGPGTEGGPTGEYGTIWPTQVEMQSMDGQGKEAGSVRVPGLLVRRASASGQLMRADEVESSSVDAAGGSEPKGKRSLMSSSSSPTSLRALFNAGAAVARSASSASSPPESHTGTINITSSIEGTLNSQGVAVQDTRAEMAGDAPIVASFDYFDQPVTYSESSSSSSTPSGALMSNGIANFNYPVDAMSSTVAHLISPLSSPLCHAQPSSLPPTPLHLIAERLPESIIAGTSINGPGRYAPGNPQFQSSVSHSRHNAPRRASSSSYLPSHPSTDSDVKVQQQDRRTSAPWTTHNYSQSLLYENRHLAQTQTGSSGATSQQYGAIHSHVKHATAEDIHPYPTQSALMRSNSTPAALRSPLKSLNRNRHSALPSRRSHIGPTRHSLNLYASTDKVIQDLSLPQQLYRHSALPQRNNSNMSHLQFHLHLQQIQQSQHHGQRSQSLPRHQSEQPHSSSLQQQSGHGVPQWQQGYSIRQHPQESDLHFGVGVSNSRADLILSSEPTSMAQGTQQESDAFSSIRPTDVLSPIGIPCSTQANTDNLRSFTTHMNASFDPNPMENATSSPSVGNISQHDLLSRQQIHQQPSSDEQHPKLQFAAGYVWKQEDEPDRVVGHTRHQSASQVYSQHPPQFQSSVQERTNWTRSLQDLTHYTTTLVDRQQRLADQTQLLRQESSMAQAPVLDQSAPQDNFGASLALDLDDNLRLLDDMDIVPEYNEYNEISRSPLASAHNGKDVMLQNVAGIPSHLEQTLVGSAPAAVLNHPTQRSIFSAVAGLGPTSQDQLHLNTQSINNALGQCTEVLHFHGDPYIDTLSFLDLSGTFMASTTASMNP